MEHRVRELADSETRARLLDALDVLEHTQPPSFEAAFALLASYVPGLPPARDEYLAYHFRRVIALILAAKDHAARAHPC